MFNADNGSYKLWRSVNNLSPHQQHFEFVKIIFFFVDYLFYSNNI